jgi:hypothetical protein
MSGFFHALFFATLEAVNTWGGRIVMLYKKIIRFVVAASLSVFACVSVDAADSVPLAACIKGTSKLQDSYTVEKDCYIKHDGKYYRIKEKNGCYFIGGLPYELQSDGSLKLSSQLSVRYEEEDDEVADSDDEEVGSQMLSSSTSSSSSSVSAVTPTISVVTPITTTTTTATTSIATSTTPTLTSTSTVTPQLPEMPTPTSLSSGSEQELKNEYVRYICFATGALEKSLSTISEYARETRENSECLEQLNAGFQLQNANVAELQKKYDDLSKTVSTLNTDFKQHVKQHKPGPETGDDIQKKANEQEKNKHLTLLRKQLDTSLHPSYKKPIDYLATAAMTVVPILQSHGYLVPLIKAAVPKAAVALITPTIAPWIAPALVSGGVCWLAYTAFVRKRAYDMFDKAVLKDNLPTEKIKNVSFFSAFCAEGKELMAPLRDCAVVCAAAGVSSFILSQQKTSLPGI